MFLWMLLMMLMLLLGMGGVAFVTLLERKLLGLSQIRLGPNKVTMFGLLQPVADGVKLLLKETFFVSISQSAIFTMSPALLMTMFMLMWSLIIPWWGYIFVSKYSSLLFFSLLGISAYNMIMIGWSSVSAFSKLGSLRSILQSLSFEVSLILIFLVVVTQYKQFNMSFNLKFIQELSLSWVTLWFMLSLMETNRAPFDLLEGESELISGFNIEFGSLPFVFLFLSEYGMVIIMVSVMLLPFFNLEVSCILVSLMLMMRSCFPRIRYDIMMNFMWCVILPISIILFMTSSVW